MSWTRLAAQSCHSSAKETGVDLKYLVGCLFESGSSGPKLICTHCIVSRFFFRGMLLTGRMSMPRHAAFEATYMRFEVNHHRA